MNTAAINYNHPFIMGLHSVLSARFNCRLCHIIGPQDTEVKYVAVFILKQFYGFYGREIAVAYTLPVPFVPTIVQRLAERYAVDNAFRNALHEILNEIEGYEDLDTRGRKIPA